MGQKPNHNNEELTVKEIGKDRKEGSDKVLLISVAVVVIVIIAIVLSARFLGQQKPRTIDEIIGATLKGEESENNFLYNNYAFVKVGDNWVTKWKKGDKLYTIPLRFNPRQVENVTIVGELDKRFDPSKLYITFDPRQEPLTYVALAAAELSVNLATALDVIPTAACAYNITEACHTRPIVSCQNNDKAVIFLREANETMVILNGNCMVIQGDEMELLRAVDRVLYIWYGIMPRGVS